MGVQIYLAQPKGREDEEARQTLAEFIAVRQGFVLMATSYGSLIVAFDERYLSAVQAHPLVDFVGSLTLNPEAPGASALQSLFANNVALQLNSRKQAETYQYPPGYRPLCWPTREEEGGE